MKKLKVGTEWEIPLSQCLYYFPVLTNESRPVVWLLQGRIDQTSKLCPLQDTVRCEIVDAVASSHSWRVSRRARPVDDAPSSLALGLLE